MTKNAPENLVWMSGPRDGVHEDAFTMGPDTEPDLLILHMAEGEILVGKDRSGEVHVVWEKTPEGMVTIEGGLDALREPIPEMDA